MTFASGEPPPDGRSRERPFLQRTASALTILTCVLLLAGAAGQWSQRLDALASFAPLLFGSLIVAGALSLAIDPPSRQTIGLCLLIGIAAGARMIAPEWLRPIPAAPRHASADFKVVSANLWVHNVEPDRTIAFLTNSGADVLLLQETNGAIASRLNRLRSAYPYRTRCKSPTCALAIFSKRPMLADRFRLRDSDNRPFGPNLFWAATTDRSGRPVTLITVHYPWPLLKYDQQRLRRELTNALRRVERDDLILAGDMNLTPWTAAMREQDAAWQPLIRQTRAVATWPARIASGAAFPIPLLPIDQVYAGPAWRHASAVRGPRIGSDHYPVIVTLRRNEDQPGAPDAPNEP